MTDTVNNKTSAAPAGGGRRRIAAVALGVVAAAALVLFLFDPARHGFYPQCPLHALTGWSCPGCGTLRGLHQVLHGNLAAAWKLNPLTVSLLPVALWLGLRELAWICSGLRWPGIVVRPGFGWALVILVVAFGVLRNLPAFHH
jgi:hypothetical protein